MTLVEHALALAAKGYPVFPVRLETGKKSPLTRNGHLDASVAPDDIQRMFAAAGDAANVIGVPTGPRSGIDALDIDRDGIAWWVDHSTEFGDTILNHTLRGGLHYLYRTHPGIRSSQGRVARGVDVRGDGGWIVWWPAYGCTSEGTTLADWPDWLLPLALPPARRAAPPAPAELAAPSAQAVIDLLTVLPNTEDVTRDRYLSICMSVQGCIRALDGEEADRAEEVMDAAAEWATRWESAGASDFEFERRKWDTDWSHRTNDIAGWRNLVGHAASLGVDVSPWTVAEARSQFAGVLGPEPAPTPAGLNPPASAGDDGPDDDQPDEWGAKMLSKQGSPDFIPNVANVLVALRESKDYQGKLGYDEMLHTATVNAGSAAAPAWRPVDDSDVTLFQVALQRAGFLALSKDTTHQAVDQVCRENAYHPVCQYLAALKWDGKRRLDTWMAVYLGAEQTAYTTGIGRMFPISMVARVMSPGVKADCMPVLEGKQGSRKSTACRILAGEWFSDSLPDLSHKDASQHLRGRWLIEVAEMSAMSRTDMNTLKSFMTRTEERYRPPHARKEVIEPRQCVFIGTTNQDRYLRDETGARRFWPVKVGTIDTDALVRDRDQLLAEARDAWQAGEKWWPDQNFEILHAQPEQDRRFEVDVWESLIARWVYGKDETTLSDLATCALGVRREDMDQAKQRRISAALRRLLWAPHHTMRGNVWRRGEDSLDDPIYAPTQTVDDIPN